LYDVGLHTGSTLSKEEVIRRTSDNIEKLMKPDVYYVALFDSETDTISFEIFVEHGHLMPKMRATLDKGGLTGSIITSGRPLLIQDWLAEADVYNKIARKIGADMLSYLGVPMKYEDQVIGVICVQCAHPPAFSTHGARLLTA